MINIKKLLPILTFCLLSLTCEQGWLEDIVDPTDPIVEGCNISTACNYNPDVTKFDDSCEYASCLDCLGYPNGVAIVDSCGTCDAAPLNDCTQDCSSTWGGTAYVDGCQICVSGNTGQTACTTETDCAGVLGGTSYADNCGTCDSDSSNDCVQDCAGTWGGSATADNCGICGGDNSDCTDCLGEIGGTATIDCAGECNGTAVDADGDGVCDDGETNPYGCTTPSACNFDATATIFDDSCWSATEGCECADGEGAVADNCGTCDTDSSNDNTPLTGNCDCAGVGGGTAVLDECGTCNNYTTQPTFPYGTCDCAGTPNGTATIDNCDVCDTDASNDCVQDCANVWGGTHADSDCGTVTDIDGNTYKTIKIGNQWWTAENLKVTHYNNGNDIQYVQSESPEPDVWENLSTGAFGYYNDDPTHQETYGNLYNWYAVDDYRGVCPGGFHVPSEAEIVELEMELGMSLDEVNSNGWRGTDEGSKLAGNSDLWNDGNLENNPEFETSGFHALPAGMRYGDNTYEYMGDKASFWSSSESNPSYARGRGLYSSLSGVYRSFFPYYNKEGGFSVRCVGD